MAAASSPSPADGAAGDSPGDPVNAARVICLRLLDRRAYSRTELARTLGRRGIPDDAAMAVLDRFTEVGLIDDHRLAEELAGAVHRERGLARRAVAAKLRQRGLDDTAVMDAVAAIDPGAERARAHELVRRRLPALRSLEPAVRCRRLVGLLARKGYPAATAWEVVTAALRADGAAPDDGSDLADGLGSD